MKLFSPNEYALQIALILLFNCCFLINGGLSEVVGHSQLKKILSDKSYISLDVNLVKVKQGTRSLLELPDESYDHDNGVYAMEDITASIPYGDLPQSYSYGTSKIKVLDFNTHLFTQSESHRIALGFLQRQFPNFFTKGKPELTIKAPEEAVSSLSGTWQFKWEILDYEGLVISDASVYVRAVDGKIVSYTTHQYDYPPHKFAANKAREKVLSKAKENKEITNIRITGILIFPASEMFRYKNLPKVIYRVGLQATHTRTGETYGTHVAVDADTGDILKIDPNTGAPQNEAFLWKVIDSQLETTPPSNDFMPIWTREGLVFISDRRLQDAPSWLDTKVQIMIRSRDGIIKYITSDLISTPLFLTGLPNSSWIGIQRSGWEYAFDLQTSEFRVLGNPLRPANTFAIKSDGAEAVITAHSHTDQSDDDVDLMVDNLNRQAPLALRTRLPQNGVETLPIFSLDGKSLYYISTHKKLNGIVYTLNRKEAVFTGSRNSIQKQEAVINELPSEPQRISIFPDGNKLLMQAKLGVYVIDLEKRKVSEVGVHKLQDKELGGVIEDVRDSCAGPTNSEFTFAGKTTDSNGNDKWRIYSCELNGNKATPLTPASQGEVENYTFPANRTTAFDSSRKLALYEVGWETNYLQR